MREVEHEIAKQALAPAGMMITRIKVTAVPSIVFGPTFFVSAVLRARRFTLGGME